MRISIFTPAAFLSLTRALPHVDEEDNANVLVTRGGVLSTRVNTDDFLPRQIFGNIQKDIENADNAVTASNWTGVATEGNAIIRELKNYYGQPWVDDVKSHRPECQKTS